MKTRVQLGIIWSVCIVACIAVAVPKASANACECWWNPTWAQGDEATAAQHYREALRLRPEYPEAHYNYAVLLQSRGSHQGAADHYRQALALRAEYVDAHYSYGNLLRATG